MRPVETVDTAFAQFPQTWNTLDFISQMRFFVEPSSGTNIEDEYFRIFLVKRISKSYLENISLRFEKEREEKNIRALRLI